MNHYLIMGLSCLFLSVGAWIFAAITGDGCTYCLWQRVILGVMGGVFFLRGTIPAWRFSVLIDILICIICAAGIVVAWHHLTAHFQSHVMHLSQLLQVYGSCSATQKPLVKDAIESAMTLTWVLTALPFWSGIFFSATAGVTLIWRPSK